MKPFACDAVSRGRPPEAAVPRSSRRRQWRPFPVALLTLAILSPPAGAAEPGGRDGRENFHRGSIQVGLLAGYGVGFRFGSNEDRRASRELADVRPVEIVPRIGFGATDPLGGDAWYRGNVEMLVEGALLFNTEPKSGFAGGAGTTLRYNFLAQRNVIPFFDANLGFIDLDFDLPGRRDGFNFNVGFGVGSHWFASERTSIATEVRWQHISNAGTKHPNNGINDVLFLIGVSRFFR